jgi:hypothetical protein
MVYSHIWLNLFVDDHQLGYITKLEKKNLVPNAQTRIWGIEVWINFVLVLLNEKKKKGYNILVHMPKIKLFINNYECNLAKWKFQPHRGGIGSWIVFEWELWCIVGNILRRTIKNWGHQPKFNCAFQKKLPKLCSTKNLHFKILKFKILFPILM